MLAWSCSNALIETPNSGFQPHSVETPLEGQTRSVTGGYGSDVMLQGYHWDSHEYDWWSVIESRGTEIGNQFQWVWFPPVSQAGSDEGYLPGQWYNLTSNYGDQQGLIDAINAIGPAKAVADIVINHRNGTTAWGDFSNPAFADNKKAITRYDEAWSNPASELFGTPEWQRGNFDTADGYGPARDLDHTNASVQTEIKAWMNWLKNTIGFSGWRYDYVKGFHGWHVGDYNAATSPEFSVGELWDDGAPASGLNTWVDQTAAVSGGKSLVFDFTTKDKLNQAFGWFKDSVDNGVAEQNYNNYNNYPNLSVLNTQYGTPSGYIGWKPENSVTFVDNHDTGSSQQHWELRGDKVYLAYVYILTHPGLPTVAWEHYFDWGTDMRNHIDYLIDLRQAENITMTSAVNIIMANNNEYVARIDDKVTVKIGPGQSYNPGSGWVLDNSGIDWAIWVEDDNNNNNPGEVLTQVFLEYVSVTGELIRIRGGHDAPLVPSYYPNRYEEIVRYNNTINPDTAGFKANDTRLDWGIQEAANGSDGFDSVLDWTTNSWPGSWGAPKYYAVDGFGEDPDNTFGPHYWKFDVTMSGNVGDWFEFKAFVYNYQNQGRDQWESDITQAGTPQSTRNHWARKGIRRSSLLTKAGLTFTRSNNNGNR
jgi:alpha-amylase